MTMLKKTPLLCICCLAIIFLISPCLFVTKLHAAQKMSVIPWEEISDKDISPDGKLALSCNTGKWKHAETHHFIHHFSDAKEAETVTIYAEVYYQWIKEMFGVSEDSWKKKEHIFIFEDKKIWEEFLKKKNVSFQGSAFTTGWELFIYRDPFFLAPRRTLAHELSHVILFRFLDGPVPLFLNEGFSEYISYKALAVHYGGNEYRIHQVQFMAQEEYIDLDEFIKMRDYPAGRIDNYYKQSELLTRFLIDKYGSKKYYLFLRQMAKDGDFRQTLEKIYSINFETLESAFKMYAIPKKKIPSRK